MVCQASRRPSHRAEAPRRQRHARPSRGRGSAVHRASTDRRKLPGRNTARGRGRRIRLGVRLAGWWWVSPPAGSAAMAHRAWVATVSVVMRMPPAGPAAVTHTARAATGRVVTCMTPVGSEAVPCMARTDSRTGRRAADTDSTDFRSRDCRNSRSTGHRSRYTGSVYTAGQKRRCQRQRQQPGNASHGHALPQPAGTAEMITWANA